MGALMQAREKEVGKKSETSLWIQKMGQKSCDVLEALYKCLDLEGAIVSP